MNFECAQWLWRLAIEKRGPATIKTMSALIIVGALLTGCAPAVPSPTPTPTEQTAAPGTRQVPPTQVRSAVPTDTATSTAAPSATLEPSPAPAPPTPTPPPTATPVPQILERIFPEGRDSLGIWANTPSDRTDCGCLHFDIGLPNGFVSGQDPVLSPASGRIVKVYSVGSERGSEGQVITIEPDPPLAGMERMLSSAAIDPSSVDRIEFILAHVTPWRTEGWVEAGESVGTPFDGWFDPDKIGYVIIVRFRNGWQEQFSPCTLPNTSSFCGRCYPGTPYNCP
jgi:hypothetical protein